MADDKIIKTDEVWRAQLTREQYHILREKGTEYPGTGEYWRHNEDGTYACAGCGQTLFPSETKFDSHCGWPSFFDSIDPKCVELIEDRTHGMLRTEVVCSRCGGHLGHIFEDGPAPTGQRYCINSVSIQFVKPDEG